MTSNKQLTQYNSMTRQTGMTLIELSIVLLILVGLAGLATPYIGSFVDSTSKSTTASSMGELNSAFGRFVSAKGKLPDNLESLTNSTTVTLAAATGGCTVNTTYLSTGNVFCGLANPAMFNGTTYTGTTGTADSIALQSLIQLTGNSQITGISALKYNDPTAANKTFGSVTTGKTGLSITSATDGTVLQVAKLLASPTAGGTVEDHLAKALGGSSTDYDSTCYDYVAFGVGDSSQLINNTLANVPVYSPSDATYGSTDYYDHYIAIVQVDTSNSGTGTNGTPCSSSTEKAKFLGSVLNVPSTQSDYLVGVSSALSSANTK